MKKVIYQATFGEQNEKQASAILNRYKKGYWVTGFNGVKHEFELLINGKIVETFRATLNNAKKHAEKRMIDEFIYLNPIKNEKLS